MIAHRVTVRYLQARQVTGKAITKIWVVRDPNPDSEMIDIVYETTPLEIVNYAIGTGSAKWEAENTTFHDNKMSAYTDAEARFTALDAAQAKKGLYPVRRRGRPVVWVTVPERE